jgi:hypothetical protein
MADEIAAYPDTPALLHRALQQSWQRDRQTRRWKLSLRWTVWWLTRYGSSVVAAILVSASSPDFIKPTSTQPTESLRLAPSYQLNSPTKNP